MIGNWPHDTEEVLGRVGLSAKEQMLVLGGRCLMFQYKWAGRMATVETNKRQIALANQVYEAWSDLNRIPSDSLFLHGYPDDEEDIVLLSSFYAGKAIGELSLESECFECHPFGYLTDSARLYYVGAEIYSLLTNYGDLSNDALHGQSLTDELIPLLRLSPFPTIDYVLFEVYLRNEEDRDDDRLPFGRTRSLALWEFYAYLDDIPLAEVLREDPCYEEGRQFIFDQLVS